ncbi:uracil-DNA glycosylase, DNA polymerase processivity factor [Choristoneura rosaceana entomopoxvirus 'L']|uniref:Uracil-DNA glycosylase n=1 Tax=Choristoneura rosaceana entomopoxvirus 'L' TaxID=1293539 RepID=A0ABM9QKT6_9POXV|nr:uracil-DNA glycosylase, DNA polymerase processivity factor [Choristoneura rosaceana entomopoxvirus 'L']CCU56136.1 uracil-DNA glycosylase, DNA polymerase processivity factor [Choristoneura rosaceana entomopoxvirus 'L']
MNTINITYDNFVNLIPEKWIKLFDKKQLSYVYYKLKNESIIKPSIDNIFNCFKYFDPSETKVIILGQDPYPTVDIADGLAFSCSSSCKHIPKSLRNIIKELLIENNKYDLLDEINIKNFNINLEYLAKQKILLLNTIFTIGDKPMSHKHIWDGISNNIIRNLTSNNKNIVFLLFGAKAHDKIYSIQNKEDHYIIKTSHPSDLSCNRDGYSNYDPFINSQCFNKCNEYLINNNIEPIDWLSGLIKN